MGKLKALLVTLLFLSAVNCHAGEVLPVHSVSGSVTPQREADIAEYWNRWHGANWQAKPTSMTNLPIEERQKRLGLKLSGGAPPTAPSLSVAPPILSSGATAGDYRNISGANYVTPIRDQGGCGDCWLFASVAALESQYLLYNDGTGQSTLDLSEQTVLSCGSTDGCSGGNPSTALAYFASTGIPAESCFGYTGSASTPCANACSNWQTGDYKAQGYTAYGLGAMNSVSLKAALIQHGPVVVAFHVYGDFMSYSTGVYHYVSGGEVGDHAVLVVGFNDAGQYFIVKNSWGTGWGLSGFFEIAYSEVAMSSTTQFGYLAWTLTGYNGTYAITASTDSNSTISPSGTTNVLMGGAQAYTISPNSGYHIASVSIDGGASVGSPTSYTFPNVGATHTIAVTSGSNPYYTITPSCSGQGTCSQTGAWQVQSGGGISISLTPINPGYQAQVSGSDTCGGSISSNTYTATASSTCTAGIAFIPLTGGKVSRMTPKVSGWALNGIGGGSNFTYEWENNSTYQWITNGTSYQWSNY